MVRRQIQSRGSYLDFKVLGSILGGLLHCLVRLLVVPLTLKDACKHTWVSTHTKHAELWNDELFRFFSYSLSLWTSARFALRLVSNVSSREVILWTDSVNDAALLVQEFE